MWVHFRKKGHDRGRVLFDYSRSATFPCIHKITKNPICATPCNGILEMCEDDSDEMCQGPGLAIVLAGTLSLTIIFLSTAFIVGDSENKESKEVYELPNYFKSVKADELDISFLKTRLSFYKSNNDTSEAIKLAMKFYKTNSLPNKTHYSKDEHLMDILGTDETTYFFYDCVDGAIGVKISLFFHDHISSLHKVCANMHLKTAWNIGLCIASISIRYSDLPKDLLLIYVIWLQLGNYGYGSFPAGLFWTLVSSIVVTEIINSFTIMIYTSISSCKWKRVMMIVMTPFLPAFYMYTNLKLKLKLFNLVRKQHTQLVQVVAERKQCYEKNCNQFQILAAKLQCTENVVENLTQLTILLLITLLGHTSTKAVDNIANIFVEKNKYLGVVLVIMSLVSMIRGKLILLKVNKNGCVGLVGSAILIPYFFIGITSRLVDSSFM